jgi:hypothetical protein
MHNNTEALCNITSRFFYGGELQALHSTPKLKNHPLSAVSDCLFNIFAATLHIWRLLPPSTTQEFKNKTKGGIRERNTETHANLKVSNRVKDTATQRKRWKGCVNRLGEEGW